MSPALAYALPLAQPTDDFSFKTPEDGVLMPEMVEAFDRNGVLVLEDFVAPQACDSLRTRAQKLVDDFKKSEEITSIFSTLSHAHSKDRYFLDSGDKIRFFFEEGAFENGKLKYPVELALNKISHAMHNLDDVFHDFSYTQRIKHTLISLGHAHPIIPQSMFIFKQPHIGGKVIFHQDATFLHAHPKPVIGLWFALEDATIENGCLWALPGLHREPLRNKYIRTGDDIGFEFYDETPWPEENAIPLPVKKGSIVVLHGFLPHGSEANTSGISRHAYTLHSVDGVDSFSDTNWLRCPMTDGFK